MSAFEKQVGGTHYKKLAIQPVELWVRWDLGGCEAAILKYVMRARMKNGLADIDKAIHFVDLLEEAVNKAYNTPYGYLERFSPALRDFAPSPNEVVNANNYSRKEAAVIYAIYDFSNQRRRSPRDLKSITATLRLALRDLRNDMVSENTSRQVIASQDAELKALMELEEAGSWVVAKMKQEVQQVMDTCCGSCGEGGECERDRV